jgi:hypothetical protein
MGISHGSTESRPTRLGRRPSSGLCRPQPTAARKNRIAIVPALPQYQPMLARVLFAAVNGMEAFPVEVEVNSGCKRLT